MEKGAITVMVGKAAGLSGLREGRSLEGSKLGG